MKTKFKMSKRILAVFLSVLMIMSVVPMTIFEASAATNRMSYQKYNGTWSGYNNTFSAVVYYGTDYAKFVLEGVDASGNIYVKKGSGFQIKVNCGRYSSSEYINSGNGIGWHFGNGSSSYYFSSDDDAYDGKPNYWAAYYGSTAVQSGITGNLANKTIKDPTAGLQASSNVDADGVFQFTTSSFPQLNTIGTYQLKMQPCFCFNRDPGALSYWATDLAWGTTSSEYFNITVNVVNELPVSPDYDTTIRPVKYGMFAGATDNRWSSGLFNIVNDQESGNTSAGILEYDISSLAGKNVTAAALNAVVKAVEQKGTDNTVPTGYYWSTADLSGYVSSTIGGKNTNIGTSGFGSGTTGLVTLLSKAGISSSEIPEHTIMSITGANSGSESSNIMTALQSAIDSGKTKFYIIIAKTTAGGKSSDGDWTDTKIDPTAQTLTFRAEDKPIVPDTEAELAALKAKIDQYETLVEDGNFYRVTNDTFNAYNNAKRYYDAVKYGDYVGNSAPTYANALSTQITLMVANKNTSYIDYLDGTTYTTKGSRGGRSISKQYTNNLIYMGGTFGYDEVNGEINAYNYYLKVPTRNTVIGYTGDSGDESTVPFQVFFFRNNTGDSTTFSGLQFSNNAWGTPNNTWYVGYSSGNDKAGVSGSIYGGGSTVGGEWLYELPNGYSSSGRTFTKSDAVSTSVAYRLNGDAYRVYEGSGYFTFNGSNMRALGPSKVYQNFNVEYQARINGNNTSSVLNSGNYYHAVYMKTYKDNYQNYKTILPLLSYKNYNGLTKTNTQIFGNVISNLSNANAINLKTHYNNFRATGDISSDVSAWATDINNGAKYLNTSLENTLESRIARVTNKYLDLQAAIIRGNEEYALGQRCYTDASWNAFVTALENAKAHMAALSPDGTANEYSTDSSLVGGLANGILNTIAGLTIADENATCHVWGNETTVQTQTCVEDGIVRYTCSVCGTIKNVVTPATGSHTWEFATWKKYNGSSKEQHWNHCTVCGEYVYEDCNYVEVPGSAVAATCETAGHEINTQCTGCGDVKTGATIPATGHSYGGPTWTWSGYVMATATFTCANCGNKQTRTAIGSAITSEVTTESSCTAEGLKTYTATITFENNTYTDTKTETLGAKDHTPAAAVRENEVAATCTTDGSYDEVVYCSVCNAELSRTSKTIPSPGHSWGTEVREDKVSATCTSDGSYDTVVYCSVCHAEKDRTSHVIPAYNHSDKEVHAAKEPTCTAAGNVAYFYCNLCHKYFNAETNAELTNNSHIIPALGHDVSSWTETQPGTCKTPAQLSGVCSRCGQTTTKQGEKDTTRHEYPTNGRATDNGDGTHSFTCSNCGKNATVKHDDCGVVTWHWAEDYSSATVDLRCSHCFVGTNYIYDVPAIVTSEVTQNPTEVMFGQVTYTAVADFDGKLSKGGTYVDPSEVPDTRTAQSPTLPKTKVVEGLVVNGVPAPAENFTYLGFNADGSTKTVYTEYGKIDGTQIKGNEDTITTKSQTGKYGVLSLENGELTYTAKKMKFSGVDTFYVLTKAEGMFTAKDVYFYYQEIKVTPSRILYYEDDFEEGSSDGIRYVDGTPYAGYTGTAYGQWSSAKSSAQTSTISFADDYASSTTLSKGAAHTVSVSNVNGTVNIDGARKSGTWPKAQFTFAGTGFDLVSLTSSQSGVFAVSVYPGTATSGTKAKSKIVDTYYGYSYGELYFRTHFKEIVFADAAYDDAVALYETNLTPDDVTEGDENYVVTNSGKVYAFEGTTPAKGWLKSEGGTTMYQVPVIHIDDLDYGTYTVVVEARFMSAYGHYNKDADGNMFYDLTLDAVRIYNPADEDDDANSAYVEAGESLVRVDKIKDLVTAAGNAGQGVKNGVIFIDGMSEITTNEMLNTYLAVSPNNELYLSAGQSVSFDLDTADYKDIQLGMREMNGTPCTVKVIYDNKEATITVNSATEIYRSLLTALGVDEINGTVVIKNTGAGILSLTNIKSIALEEPITAYAAPMMFSMATAPRAKALLAMAASDLSIDEEAIETSASEDGTVTLKVTTSTDVSKLVIRDKDGNVITPDSLSAMVGEDENTVTWTVVLSEEKSGVYTYTLQGEYENGYTDCDPVSVTVEIEIADETGNLGDESTDGTGGHGFSLFDWIIRIIKKILTKVFGISFD